MDSAFYEPVGPDSYLATSATIGPWSDDAQHGGPPSALVARAIERHEPDKRQRLARVAVDILRPVPIGKVSVRARTVRPGRRVTLVEAVLEADGQEVLHARGWRIERPSGEVPAVPDGGRDPGTVPQASDGPTPSIFEHAQRHRQAQDRQAHRDQQAQQHQQHQHANSHQHRAPHEDGEPQQPQPHGYLGYIEWRFMPEQAGVRVAWTRPRIPLLPGEEPSPMSRALLVADSGSGLGAALPASEFIFINVDLSVVLPRDPAGEWLLLESSTTIGADGTGLATTRLSDQLGACGRGWQTLLVAPRA